MRHPTLVQHLRYDLGGALPDPLRPWVTRDLLGKGATRRYLTRVLLIAAPILSLSLVIPGPMWVSGLMVAMILIPTVYFAVALTYVYRRSRLRQHGLDYRLGDRCRPGAADDRARFRAAYGHE